MADANGEIERTYSAMTEYTTGPHDEAFTIFVVQPNYQVCTLRNIPSGISVFDIKGRLELTCGVPCQLYQLYHPDGQPIPDEQRLHVGETIQDGRLIKMRLHASWKSLYDDVYKNNIEHVVNSCGVHVQCHVAVGVEKDAKHESAVRERRFVAMYIASYLGHCRMVKSLLNTGVDTGLCTPFGRTCLHAAAAADDLDGLELLLNHGASFQRTDYHGSTPLDVAYQMRSTSCAKKLKSLRIHHGSSNGLSRSRDCISRQSKSDGEEHAQGETGENGQPVSANYNGRTTSSLSHYSTRSDGRGQVRNKQVPTARICMSSVPRVKNDEPKTFDKTQHDSVENLKRSVRWEEANRYEGYKNIPAVSDRRRLHTSLIKAVRIKPIVLHRQETNVTADDLPSQEAKQPEVAADSTDDDNNILVSSTLARLSRRRLKYNKKSSVWSNMRRKLTIAVKANNEMSEEKPANVEAFKHWLRKKRIEAEEAAEESDTSSDESNNDSDDNRDRLAKFNKWVRRYNRHENTNIHCDPRNQTQRNVIKVGSTMQGDSRNPSAHLHITAHREWQKKRRHGTTPIQRRTLNDIKAERRQLEEKRQKLLLQAISYEEWMDHTEEKKFLIKQILKADVQDIKKLEEDKNKDKTGLYSYEIWHEKMKTRQAEESKRKGIIKMYEDQQAETRTLWVRSSAAVSFQDWSDAKQRVNVGKSSSKTSTR